MKRIYLIAVLFLIAVSGFSRSLYANNETNIHFGTEPKKECSFFHFNVIKINEEVNTLSWSTSNTANTSHFKVERSSDGTEWSTIAIVFPVEKESTLDEYSYIDKSSGTGVAYYRIRHIDNKGKIKYSPIKVINGSGKEAIAFVSAASEKMIAVELARSMDSTVTVSLLNENGLIVRKQKFAKDESTLSLSGKEFPSGIYFVQVADQEGIFLIQKLAL